MWNHTLFCFFLDFSTKRTFRYLANNEQEKEKPEAIRVMK